MTTAIDFRCVDDFDEALRMATERELIGQAAYHRITNVSVCGETDDHVNFGIDLRGRLNAPETDIASECDEAVQRDPRILDTTTTVVKSDGESTEEVNMTVRIEMDTTAGPVDLVVLASALTVDILEGA